MGYKIVEYRPGKFRVVSDSGEAEEETHPYFRPRFKELKYRMFWGGADINPELYGEKNRGLSHCSDGADKLDISLYELCKKNGLAAGGICRGAQFLWAMSGGKLVQDIKPRHFSPHMVDGKGLSFIVNSYHHQGCILTDGKPPNGITVLAMHRGVVEAFEGVNKDGVSVVAVQWHPEMLDPMYTCAEFFERKLEEINADTKVR